MDVVSNDAILAERSGPQDVILQLQQRIRETKATYSTQSSFQINTLDLARQRFDAAKKEWERMQRQCRTNLNLVQSREQEEVHRLQSKILLYRIMHRHGPEVCVEAYDIASSAEVTDYDDIKSKANTPVAEGEEIPKEILHNQIAWDLLQGRLGLFPSSDADEWINYARSKLFGGLVQIDMGGLWVSSWSVDILGEAPPPHDEENPATPPEREGYCVIDLREYLDEATYKGNYASNIEDIV